MSGGVAIPVSERRRTDILAAVFYGIAGVAILSLQPLAFGPLVAAGALTESQLGTVTGVETAGLALASALLPGWLTRGAFRGKLSMFALVMVACNLLSRQGVGFDALMALRLTCGLAEGGILAGAFVVLFHSGDPDRMNALFLAVSNTILAFISYIIPVEVLPRLGAWGTFPIMAGIGLGAIIAILAIRHRPTAMPMPVSGWRQWPKATWLVLAGIVLQNGGVIAGWVFLESTARASNFGPRTLALSASLGLLAQVAGASTVAAWGYRLPAGRSLMFGGTILAAAILWLGNPSSDATFITANLLMGFLWLSLLPLSIKLICEIERNNQALYLTAAAQMLGLSIGPLLASLVVSRESVAPAYAVGCGMAALAVVLFAIARNSGDRVRRPNISPNTATSISE